MPLFVAPFIALLVVALVVQAALIAGALYLMYRFGVVVVRKGMIEAQEELERRTPR